jgi:tRNA modification GTPase
MVGALLRCRRSLNEREIGEIVIARWREAEGEEVVAARTGDMAVEVHCHGGAAASAAILRSLAEAGARVVDWKEWLVARGESNALEIEATDALAHATTERTALILLDQQRGALAREAQAALADLRAGDTYGAKERVIALLSCNTAPYLTEPFEIVLAGPPNSGKSSLLNALAGYERAIVHHEPGTTRDVVEAVTAIDGWPCHLRDTAGLRETKDELEREGIARAHGALDEADLVLICVAADQGWAEQHDDLRQRYPRAIVVGTKLDLGAATSVGMNIATSAKTLEGIDQLLAHIGRRLVPSAPAAGEAVAFTYRQFGWLTRAKLALDRGNVAEGEVALAALLAGAELPDLPDIAALFAARRELGRVSSSPDC